ncbi:uncharacterized protein LOC135149648 [Daucus carota subsp. sativus]|uniref:uncharacterized protein LOC135149648 n=1 Tax=Daucus carota subsp. sativus TaxID=79200 RepID=UPI003083B7B3
MADSLSKLLEGEYTTSDGPVYFLSLPHPSTESKEQFNITLNEDNWMTPLIAYLRSGTLPNEHSKARQVKAHAAKFFLQGDVLYRRNFDSPILKCVDDDEATYCMREVHEGICGDHMAGKALTHKILRQGYYWPTMAKDCKPLSERATNASFSATSHAQPPQSQFQYSPLSRSLCGGSTLWDHSPKPAGNSNLSWWPSII